MDNWLMVISKVLPVIWLLFLGNILSKFKFIKQNTINELKKIIVNISLPALLFMAFAETGLELKYLYLVIVIFITCAIMLLAVCSLESSARWKIAIFQPCSVVSKRG